MSSLRIISNRRFVYNIDDGVIIVIAVYLCKPTSCAVSSSCCKTRSCWTSWTSSCPSASCWASYFAARCVPDGIKWCTTETSQIIARRCFLLGWYCRDRANFSNFFYSASLPSISFDEQIVVTLTRNNVGLQLTFTGVVDTCLIRYKTCTNGLRYEKRA